MEGGSDKCRKRSKRQKKGSTSTPEADELAEKVFGNDLLLEIILKQAMRPNLGFSPEATHTTTLSRFSHLEVEKLRSVSRSWMETVSTIHRRSMKPLFHLRLTHENYSGLVLEGSKCLLEQLVTQQYASSMASWGLEGSRNVLPFHLKLTPSFFEVADEAGYNRLFDFLNKFGEHGMVGFTFNFFRRSFNHLPKTLPEFHFPSLRVIVLHIERMSWPFVPLIKRIIDGSPHLETVDITSGSPTVTYTIPRLQRRIDEITKGKPYILRLPPTTKHLYLYYILDSCSCFYNVPEDNLKSLQTLSLSAAPCVTGRLEEIMGSLKDHLVNLNFIGFASCAFAFNRQYKFTLPQMPKLECLTINFPWELKSGSWFNYNLLPDLKHIKLVNYEPDVFHTVTLSKHSETVESCRLVFIQPYIYSDRGSRNSTPKMMATNSGLVSSASRAFPNMTHLEIGVNGSYGLALSQIFDTMSHLKSLTLFVESSSRFVTTICWDSVFTGLPTIACQAMQDNRRYWDNVSLPDSKFTSIRKLTNLEALYLVETSYPACRAFGDHTSATEGPLGCRLEHEELHPFPYPCSELSFHFSFFKMSKLSRLGMTKGFWPPEHVQRQWEELKGTKLRTLRSPKLYHLIVDKFSVFDGSWYTN